MVFSMNICLKEARLQKYQDMVKAIAEEYCKRLNNSFLFEMKVSSLQVDMMSTQELTAGVCRKIGNRWQIILAMNEKNGEAYIAFVIAHEFAHLLFQKVSDVLCVTGKASDGSTELTSITRISSNGLVYGRELEEHCADILALYIIQKMGYSLEDDFLKDDLAKTEEMREEIKKLISVFGKEIESGEFIDDYSVDANGYGVVSNVFWYYAVNNSLAEIVRSYDDFMGDNKFSELCEAFDTQESPEAVVFARNQVNKLIERALKKV